MNATPARPAKAKTNFISQILLPYGFVTKLVNLAGITPIVCSFASSCSLKTTQAKPAQSTRHLYIYRMPYPSFVRKPSAAIGVKAVDLGGLKEVKNPFIEMAARH
jgi:hypothetical protein